MFWIYMTYCCITNFLLLELEQVVCRSCSNFNTWTSQLNCVVVQRVFTKSARPVVSKVFIKGLFWSQGPHWQMRTDMHSTMWIIYTCLVTRRLDQTRGPTAPPAWITYDSAAQPRRGSPPAGRRSGWPWPGCACHTRVGVTIMVT